MATLLKCGGLFLHVPKTGGNWVRDVLDAHDLVYAHIGGKHAGPRQLAPLERLLQVPHRYDRPNRPLFKFCFVRHPLRWYESWYRMNVARGWPTWDEDEEAWNPSVELNGLGAPDFTRFIENVLTRRPGFVSDLFDYYAGDAHFVGRQETMAEDLAAVFATLGIALPAASLRRRARVNVSDEASVSLAPALRQDVEASERRGYERYGYTREAPSPDSPTTHGERLVPIALGPGPFTPAGGVAWRAPVPAVVHLADTQEFPCRSPLQLYEDGRPLPHAHALHDDVRTTGRGRFSHWEHAVVFSTSDNSDPNTNGRRYTADWAVAAPGVVTTLRQRPPVETLGATP
ncbi:MAG: hypothetical protein Q8L86_03985 [Vicinamibacterales bacterium]|nr:hypothetical protein [Vicinamibacterales bacterium]